MKRTPLNPVSGRGLAMIEAVVSVIIVAVMLVAALRTVGASRVGQINNSDRLRANYLATELMAEILDMSYSDPNEIALFGPELSEIATGRAAYDDVDDYHNWTQSPPQRRDGSTIPGLTGWSRSVQVVWVDPTNVGNTSLVETNCKRITVTVARKSGAVVRRIGYRTAAAPR